jgi:hypothetical protein
MVKVSEHRPARIIHIDGAPCDSERFIVRHENTEANRETALAEIIKREEEHRAAVAGSD